MSFQAASGPFPTQPNGLGSRPTGPQTSGVFPPSSMPPSGGLYSSVGVPVAGGPGMYVVGPPGMMNMGPPHAPFPGMRPGMSAQPGILPMPPMPPAVMLPLHSPMRPVISAPPQFSPRQPTIQARIPVISPSAMKVATTVFVGNISERSSDTLLRQILLRCGRIEGWKRVQDASGKLQGFGFCEYGDPESTLRAMRLLHNFKLGDKRLVVKVDSKTRTDLLKYVLKKKHKTDQETVDDAEIEKEVEGMDEKKGTEMLKEVTDDAQKEADEQIVTAITALVKENVEVLVGSNRNAADEKLEKDVKEALFAIAKQQGKVDPNCTLDDMDMEDDMKTLVSGEIKKFRLSSERQALEKHKLRERERERRRTDIDTAAGGSPGPSSPRERDDKRKRASSPQERPRSPIQRPRTPVKRRSRTPSPRTRAKERQEREALRKEKERQESLREEESYEAKILQRKQRIRERTYKERLSMWEGRERRKAKEYNKDLEKEEQRKEEMEREGRDLGEFLEDYDDTKDDQRYYKGGQFARRRRERELEKEEDEKDRQREKEEIEALRLEVMERQVKEWQREQEGNDVREGSTGSSSPQHSREDDEDEEVPKVEMEEDIPLAKTGFPLTSAFPPIQVQSAPDVEHPELKSHPRDTSEGDGITIQSREDSNNQWTRDDGVGGAEEDMDVDSPRAGVKMSFGVRSKTGGNGSNDTPTRKRAVETNVLGEEEEGDADTPKRKLASIQQIEREQRDEKKVLEREVNRMALKYSGEDRKKIPPEEKKKMIQALVKGIPTSKEELFEYELKWEAIDQNLMEKRIGPWINKKIVEYIGEEELTLTEFICNKLATHIPADTILEELAMVLDEEAEVFVVKLWRLLIYETEAKYLGIAKTY